MVQGLGGNNPYSYNQINNAPSIQPTDFGQSRVQHDANPLAANGNNYNIQFGDIFSAFIQQALGSSNFGTFFSGFSGSTTPLPRTEVLEPRGSNPAVNNVKSLIPRHVLQNGAVNLVQETSGDPTEYTVNSGGQVNRILFPSGEEGNRDAVYYENGVLHAGGNLGEGKYFNRIGDQLVFVDPDYAEGNADARAELLANNENANKVSIFSYREGEGIVHFQTTLDDSESLQDGIDRVNTHADDAVAAEVDTVSEDRGGEGEVAVASADVEEPAPAESEASESADVTTA